MNRIVLLILSFLLIESHALRAQEKEKMIVHQSTLIDALREEQTGNRTKAIGLLEKLKYEPEFKAVSLYYLARWYASDGKTSEAYQAITESVTTEPDNKWYLVFKANLAEEQGLYAETAETYRLLGKLEPEAYTHLDNTAFFYLKAGDPEKALDILNAAEQKFGLLPPLAIKKSYLLKQTGKEKKAIELLERCLAQYPNHTGLLEQLLQLSHEQKWNAGIEKYGGLLQQLDPGNTVLLKYLRSNPANPESPGDNLSGIISSESYAMDDKIKFMIQNMEGLMRKPDTAGLRALIPFALQLVTQAPHDPKPYALAGDLYYQLDDLFSARLQYIRSTEQGPVPYTVWDNL
ncbi:MAG TPA: tetratricopeptide repeat protein [Saprospiraceae bacterium]|nr:tetratricopeptide repeat protein [Saprospiraceae bacterium]